MVGVSVCEGSVRVVGVSVLGVSVWWVWWVCPCGGCVRARGEAAGGARCVREGGCGEARAGASQTSRSTVLVKGQRSTVNGQRYLLAHGGAANFTVYSLKHLNVRPHVPAPYRA